MTPPAISARDAANEFFRRIIVGDENVNQPFAQLQKASLNELTGLGDRFFDALDLAHERLVQAPSESRLQRDAFLTFHGIIQFGVAWENELLQDRGFESLANARTLALECD